MDWNIIIWRVVGFYSIIIGFMIYFFPTWAAYKLDRKNVVPIFVLNLTLGWTGLGWIGALIWSLCR